MRYRASFDLSDSLDAGSRARSVDEAVPSVEVSPGPMTFGSRPPVSFRLAAVQRIRRVQRIGHTR